MKKFLCILLCLMLLPILSLAEEAQLVTVDFGDFTMNGMSNDTLQQGEKANGAVMAILTPTAFQGGALSPNINIIWFEESILPMVNMLGSEAYAQAVVESIGPQMEAAGLGVADMTLLGAELMESEENNCTILLIAYALNVDYTNLGVDIQTAMYQEMAYMFPADASKGMYSITLTAYDPDTIAAMEEIYLQSVVFAN